MSFALLVAWMKRTEIVLEDKPKRKNMIKPTGKKVKDNRYLLSFDVRIICL